MSDTPNDAPQAATAGMNNPLGTRTEQTADQKRQAALHLVMDMERHAGAWQAQGDRLEVIALAVASWIDAHTEGRQAERLVIPALFNSFVANTMAAFDAARAVLPGEVARMAREAADRASAEGMTAEQAQAVFQTALRDAAAQDPEEHGRVRAELDRLAAGAAPDITEGREVAAAVTEERQAPELAAAPKPTAGASSSATGELS